MRDPFVPQPLIHANAVISPGSYIGAKALNPSRVGEGAAGSVLAEGKTIPPVDPDDGSAGQAGL